jgi:hypothetical protein
VLAPAFTYPGRDGQEADMHDTTESTGGSATREPRVLDAPELTFELGDALDQLRAEPGYRDFGRSSVTLARSGPLRMVLTAAQRGVELGAFEAEGPVAVHVLEGSVTGGRADGGTYGPGALIWFGAGGSWAIRVDEDAALLMAVSGDAGAGPR